MIINYLKFASRNLMRNKAFSTINICGLVVSLTAFMLMALYIENELNFDRFNTKADHIYRVVDDKKNNALMQHGAGSAGPMAPALLNDFPKLNKRHALLVPKDWLNMAISFLKNAAFFLPMHPYLKYLI